MPPDGFEAGRGWAPNEVLINGRAFFRATTLPTIYIYIFNTNVTISKHGLSWKNGHSRAPLGRALG